MTEEKVEEQAVEQAEVAPRQLRAAIAITLDMEGKPGFNAKGLTPWDAFKLLRWAEDQLLYAKVEVKEEVADGDESGAGEAADGGDSPAEAGAEGLSAETAR